MNMLSSTLIRQYKYEIGINNNARQIHTRLGHCSQILKARPHLRLKFIRYEIKN